MEVRVRVRIRIRVWIRVQVRVRVRHRVRARVRAGALVLRASVKGHPSVEYGDVAVHRFFDPSPLASRRKVVACALQDSRAVLSCARLCTHTFGNDLLLALRKQQPAPIARRGRVVGDGRHQCRGAVRDDIAVA